MPVYQYQGQHFDLPDGLSNEEAIGKIKKHLGQAPKEEGPSFIDKAQNLASGLMSTPGLKNFQIPTSFATGIVGQVAGGLRGAANLMSGGDVNSANKVMEDTQQAMTYQPRDESQQVGNDLLGQAMQMPADVAGEALGSMGADIGHENLGRTLGEAGMNIGLNVAPLAHGLVRPRPMEAPRPVPNVEAMRPVTPEAGANFAKDPEAWRQQQLAERTRLDAQDLASTDNTLHQQPLFDQPSEGRPPSPHEAVTGDWRIDENGMPIKVDLSMDVQNASEPLQRNMWGDELPRKHEQESIPLTEAMDSMGRVELSDAIARELTGAVEPSGELQSAIVRATPDRVSNRFGGNQRGNAGFLKDALDKFDEWYTGSPSKLERTRSLEEQSSRTNAEQQKTGPGHYITQSKDLAGVYGGPEGRMYKVHEPFKNPYDLNQPGRQAEYDANVAHFGSKARANQAIQARGHDAITFTNGRGEKIANIFHPRSVTDIGAAREATKAVDWNKVSVEGAPKDHTNNFYDSATPPTDFPIKRTFTPPRNQRGSAPVINHLAALIESAAKKGSEALRELHSSLYKQYADSGYKNKAYLDAAHEAVQREVEIKKQEDYVSNIKNPELGVVGPNGQTYIPSGTRIIATHGTKFKEPTRGTVVGEKQIQINGKPYRFPVVDFGGGEIRTLGYGDVKQVFQGPKNQRGSAPIINDIAKALIRKMKGQTESGTVKNSPVGEVPVAKDSMATPTDPATIAKKQDIREKLDASSVLKKIAPEYSSITTPQEAIQLAKDYKDIGNVPGVDNFRNATISGMNGMVMLKRNNPVFNFLRFKNQEWRNISTKFSKDYVTAKDGFATLGRELSKPELVQAMETLKKAADARIAITADNIGKLGLSTKQEGFILSVRKAMDAMDAMRGDAMLSTGRAPAKSLLGYLPSIWTGAYKGMIRVGDRVIAVPQSDTYLGYKNAVKAILKDNPSATVVDFPRKGLNAMYQGNNMFNGFNDVLNVLAKNDPGLAHLQQVAAMKINDATHQVMGFHIHEMAKQGVKGALGDRAHVSASRNAHDLFKALVDYAEQGAEYYSMQKGLNEIGQVLTDPALEHLPNTKAVAEQYVKHVSGQDLNPIGAALNWTVDALPRALGMSSKVPLQGLRGLKTAMGIHMMGLWNPTFIGLQATQVFTGAMPEIIKVGSKLHQDVTASTAIGPTAMLAMRAAEAAGKEMPSFVPEHLQAAYKYAQDHGIMQLSELENAKNASRNKAVSTAEEIGALPIKLGEVITRPPVFMIFADIFHKFGLKNEEAFMAAHHATNISMGDYHPSERPQIYSQLGIMGEFGGALTTYKHNALTNMYLHGRGAVAKDVAGNRQYAAAASAVAAGAMFYGITGMPGFDELDSAYQWATGQLGNSQGIRETALETMPEWSKSGFLSASTGLDFQSRTSMSKVLPEMKMSSLSPQLGALADIGVKAYAYGQYGDQQSFNDLMKSITPNGLKGYTEDKLMTDPDGTVRNAAGEQMAPEPRTDKERLIRKVFAVRPLRESIESKDVYIDAKNVQAKEKAQNQIAQRFRQAFASGDTKGMTTLAQMYYDKEGDPQTLLNDQAIQNQIYKSNISQRDRMTGMLTATMKSVNRYRDMNDGK